MTLKEFFGFSWLKNIFSNRSPSANAFELTESMWGYISPLDLPSHFENEFPPLEEVVFRDAYETGKNAGTKLSFEVTLRVENFEAFIAPAGRRGPMDGFVSCNLFGERLPIFDGEYGLYWVEPKTGERRISYRFSFADKQGIQYRFSGIKKIVHDKSSFDVLADHTTLFSVIRRLGGDAPVVSMGIIHYHVEDFPAMLFSIRTPKEDTLLNRTRVAARFFSFINKELSEYVAAIKPYYRAEYNNFVLSGVCPTGDTDARVFLFSGAHDKGFPWGDNVGFSDLGLIIDEGEKQRRFAFGAHAAPELKILIAGGTFSFIGTVFELIEGNQVCFSDMQDAQDSEHLKQTEINIQFRFDARSVRKKNTPFECDTDGLTKHHSEAWASLKAEGLAGELEKWRDIPDVLGYTSEVFRLDNLRGSLGVDGLEYNIDPLKSLGEAENGTISSLRQPPLHYNYFCALEPASRLFRIFVRSGVLRTLSENAVQAKVGSVLGNLVGQFVKMSFQVDEQGASEMDWQVAKSLTVPSQPLLEIAFDHYPTAVFHRRIVSLPGMIESAAWALEENMSVINLTPSGTDRTATVAAIKRPDRFEALEEVIAATGLCEKLDAACIASGKSRSDFSVVIKTSFSFMYSLTDRSSFTDPDLVEHLMDRLYEKGYRRLTLAEARSTYAGFFTNREVQTLARYVGYKPRNYQIVDLSVDAVPHDFGGTLGKSQVHPAWRDADFRISFAKNKSHSYAFYTLTIKNIYGALSEANKFKVYHCGKNMGIYAPTMDFLDAFPVHFGFIDAYLSADGAFGIFADKEPNFTETIIGGDDLIAVDWVGASKMGMNPLVSEYMNLAVARFGKPKITLIGDHSLYQNWRNVPDILSKTAHDLDQHYVFGNFLYSVMSSMDPFFQFKMDEVGRRAARFLATPVRKILFEWVTGNREELTWDHLKKMFDADQLKYLHELMESFTKED